MNQHVHELPNYAQPDRRAFQSVDLRDFLREILQEAEARLERQGVDERLDAEAVGVLVS